MKHRSPRPSYGIDGPYYLFGLTAVSAVAVVAAFSSAGAGSAVLLGTLALATAIPAALGAIYVAKGKLAHRDRLLAQIAWRGDEQVLDVGTGGGLLMIGAARRVPEGRVFGVDLWRGADLSGNRRARTLGNAAIEGVADRVEVRDEDARSLSFPSATFDCVLSMLCLHNIQDGLQIIMASHDPHVQDRAEEHRLLRLRREKRRLRGAVKVRCERVEALLGARVGDGAHVRFLARFGHIVSLQNRRSFGSRREQVGRSTVDRGAGRGGGRLSGNDHPLEWKRPEDRGAVHN